MTIPQWVLLGFAGWTLLVLFGTIGAYRWSRILTGRVRISEWQADVSQGSDWYRRAMRAHMNCIENLPVYGAIVVCATAAGVTGPVMDKLAMVILAARIAQSLVHIAAPPSDFMASVRFVLFFAQAVCMIWMGALITSTVVG